LLTPGNINIPFTTFYFKYNIPINLINGKSADKIVELVLDDTGSPVRPYQRKQIYRIGTAIDFRSDHGKLEYYKIDCYGEQVKFLNGPQG
jgi:hypothetical protein